MILVAGLAAAVWADPEEEAHLLVAAAALPQWMVRSADSLAERMHDFIGVARPLLFI